MDVVGAEPLQVETTTRRVPLIRWTHGLVNRCVMLSDASALILGTALTWHPGDASAIRLTLPQGLVIGLIAAVGWLGVLRRAGAYRVERYRRPARVAADVALGSLSGSLLSGLVVAVFADTLHNLPRILVGMGEVLGVVVAARLGVAVVVGMVLRRRLLRAKVAVIGANPEGLAVLCHLSGPAMADRFEIVGLYRDDHETVLPSPGLFAGVLSGDVEELGRYAQFNPVDLIVVCIPWPSAERRQEVIEAVQWIAADVVIPIGGIDQPIPNAQVATIGGLQTLQVLHRPFKGTQGLLKVAEDYLVGGVALLIASPLMLLVALAIRLDSPGPALFRQARTGFNNQTFMIFKFRTMLVDPSDDGSVGTTRPDHPRITRVGGLLRRLSIDELPQLLNVMRGEMSVVGPRPYVPNMLVGQSRFTDSVRQYAARHRIKPGITGWAQANGLRGNALRTLEGARRSVALDMYYITHWSLLFDLQIMLRTVMVLVGRNVF